MFDVDKRSAVKEKEEDEEWDIYNLKKIIIIILLVLLVVNVGLAIGQYYIGKKKVSV